MTSRMYRGYLIRWSDERACYDVWRNGVSVFGANSMEAAKAEVDRVLGPVKARKAKVAA